MDVSDNTWGRRLKETRIVSVHFRSASVLLTLSGAGKSLIRM